MLCTGECHYQSGEYRRIGFLSRVFRKCFSTGGLIGAKKKNPGLVDLSRCPETLVLGKLRLEIVKMSGRCEIYCTGGVIWVTCSRRFSDYILKNGESIILRGEGTVIISSGSKGAEVRICKA